MQVFVRGHVPRRGRRASSSLARTTATADSDQPAPTIGAGLGFDNECRLYHSVPSENRVERVLWRALDPLGPALAQPQPMDLFASRGRDMNNAVGDFAIAQTAAAASEPRGIAVDVNDRLFVAEAGGTRILIYDLWSERLSSTGQCFLAPGRPTSRHTGMTCMPCSPPHGRSFA